eukprot:scaffold105761_cov31-Tisochrysis_lutea.AAC.1
MSTVEQPTAKGGEILQRIGHVARRTSHVTRERHDDVVRGSPADSRQPTERSERGARSVLRRRRERSETFLSWEIGGSQKCEM